MRTQVFLALGAALLLGCGGNTPQSGGFVGGTDVTPNFGGITGSDSAGVGDVIADTHGATLDVADTGAPDTGAPPDTSVADAGALDTGAVDTGVADTGAADTGAADTGAADTTASDTGAAPCGDNVCAASESCQTCPADCGFCPKNCGDKTCSADENCKTCPGDCGACPVGCGDGTCNAATENCQTCPLDCGKCPALCGDGACNGMETCSSCTADCGACPGTCGDGTCDSKKEDCKTCSADCGKCPAGACEPLTSKGCTAAQQCYPTSTGALCGVPGSKAESAACSLTTECAKGMLCVGKVCKKLCDSSGKNASYACSAGTCDGLQYGDGKPVGYDLGTCVVYNTCNALTDAGCPTTQSCVNVAKGKVCIPTGTKTAGQGCQAASDCVKGTMCIGNPARCLTKCGAIGSSPGCPSGQKCLTVTVGTPAKPAPDNLGVCDTK